MMISGLRWQTCQSCPAKFLVLTESTRTRCLDCEQKRESLKRRHKEAKRWHKDKKAAPVETRPSCRSRGVQPFVVSSGPGTVNITEGARP